MQVLSCPFTRFHYSFPSCHFPRLRETSISLGRTELGRQPHWGPGSGCHHQCPTAALAAAELSQGFPQRRALALATTWRRHGTNGSPAQRWEAAENTIPTQPGGGCEPRHFGKKGAEWSGHRVWGDRVASPGWDHPRVSRGKGRVKFRARGCVKITLWIVCSLFDSTFCILVWSICAISQYLQSASWFECWLLRKGLADFICLPGSLQSATTTASKHSTCETKRSASFQQWRFWGCHCCYPWHGNGVRFRPTGATWYIFSYWYPCFGGCLRSDGARTWDRPTAAFSCWIRWLLTLATSKDIATLSIS